MTAHLYDTSASPGREPIEELTVVRLVNSADDDARRNLPAGSLGAVVFVHDEGEAYEVEFTSPITTVVTLRRNDIEPLETIRDGAGHAAGVHYRRG